MLKTPEALIVKMLIRILPLAAESGILRNGIEPVIGHCKSDHRLGRNFYKGLFGDSINVMLAAAAYNLKRAMRALLCLFRWGLMRLMIEGQWPVVTCNVGTCARERSFKARLAIWTLNNALSIRHHSFTEQDDN